MRVPAISGVLSLLLAAMSTGPALAGDAAQGEKVFNRCKICHTIDEGGAPKQGPNLFGVYGRSAGAAEPGTLDSGKLQETDIVWDEVTLTEWLAAPSTMVPGVKMTFRLTKEDDIANIIAYLKANSPDAQ